jgi:hypothetical protein
MSKPQGAAYSELPDGFERFPVPAFDRDRFKGMAWQAPTPLSEEDVARLIERQASGDPSAYGAYPIMAGQEFLKTLDLRGDHAHAVLCVLPNAEVTIIGRSYAWPIQKAWLVTSLDPAELEVVAEWRTPRPMNTRLGPDHGITHAGGILYALCGHGHGAHWIGNRTILDNDWDGPDGHQGFRILSSSADDSTDFHDCNLSYAWRA